MPEPYTLNLGSSTSYPMNIVLSVAVNYPITVTYNTQDGTAIGTGSGGTRFRTITNQTVTIPAHSTSIPISVDIYHDDPIELDQGFSVVLSSPTGSGGVLLGTPSTASIDIPAQSTAPDTLPLCYQDDFTSSTLDSTWRILSSSGGFTPKIDTINHLLQLTSASDKEANAITKDFQFPSAQNVIVMEFTHYAYSGSGADGFAFILYDSAAGANPTVGAFGGSLGYAQKSYPGSDCTVAGGCPGFQKGWLGLGLDEYGNYSNPTEGRIGGPGSVQNAVAIRGSGSGQTGYNYLQGTPSLAPVLWTNSATPSPGDKFRMTVDARDSAHLYITLERATTGNVYKTVINQFDAKAPGYNQATAPAFVRLALTASTGGSNAIHGVGNLKVWGRCTPYNPNITTTFDGWENLGNDGTTPPATRNIYTKLTGTQTQLRVGSIDSSGSVYVNPTTAVAWRLINSSACPTGDNNITGWTTIPSFNTTNPQTITFTPTLSNQNIRLQFATLTNGTYTKTNCSTDNFAIRPANYTATFSPTGTLKAGNSFNLTLKADQNYIGYGGTATVSPLTQISSCPVLDGNLTNASGSKLTSVTFNSANDQNASNSIKFGDVGNYNITVSDSTWTNVDSIKFPPECSNDNYTGNPSLNGGKVGCLIQSTFTKTVIPDHFGLNTTSLTGHHTSYTYLSSDLSMPMSADLNTTVTAQALGGSTTQNYNAGCYANNTNYKLYYTLTPSPIPNLNKLNFKINFDRNVTIPVNPFSMSLTQIDANDTNNVSVTSAFSNLSTTFLYGRAFAPRYRFTGNTGNAKIFYESYCDSAGNKSMLPSGSIGDSSSVGWYLNVNHNAATDGNITAITEKNTPIKVTNSSALPLSSSGGSSTSALTYSGTTFPYKTTMQDTADSWLLYNPTSATPSPNEFEVEFYGGSNNWTGHKNNTTTTDSVAAPVTSKRILW